MIPVRPLLPLLLLAGCQTAASRAYDPVENVRYSAIGQDPFWMVTIGDDSIVLTLGAEGRLLEQQYPRVLPRTVDGVRRWQSERDGAMITVETRPDPCTGADGGRFPDRVRVRLNGRELIGCGGRRLDGASG